MKVGRTVVYLLGVFDGLHIGHVKLIERASQLGDELVIGIVDDEAIKKQKGNDRPLFPYNQRSLIVASLQWVDRTYKLNNFSPNELINKDPNLLSNKIFVFGEDQQHLEPLTINNIIQVTLPRTPGISTSEIIGKIKQ